MVTNKEEFQRHQGALSGNIMHTAGLAIDQVITQRKDELKKSLKDEFTQIAMDVLMDAYTCLMEQLNRELEALDKALEQLRTDMNENRLQVLRNADILNNIDDLFNGRDLSSKLNRELAASIADAAGLPGNALANRSDAECITIIEEIRANTLQVNEDLGVQYNDFEDNQNLLLERRSLVSDAKTRLEAISANDDLDNTQKLEAVRALGNEFNATTKHKISNQLDDNETKQIMDEAYLEDKESIIQNSQSFKPVF